MEEKVRNLLVKDPFRRIMPKGNYIPVITDGLFQISSIDVDRPRYEIVSQNDFLREYFVSGHKINDPAWYPDKTTFNDSAAIKQLYGKGVWQTEKVARCAFPFQFIITLKQLVHLCGNKIYLNDSNANLSEKTKEIMTDFRQGWIDENMEVAWWNCAKSEKITGDCAIAFYIKGKEFGWRTFSFEKGDTLYPHYDMVTGKLNKFARKYNRIKNGGTVEIVEAWDNAYVYTFEKDDSSFIGKTKNAILDFFGLDGYRITGGPTRHGYPYCPVIYKRNAHGPCWSPSQDSIDTYELSVSQLCENNKSYAFPILVILAEDVDIKGSASTGRPYAITSTDPNAKVDLLTKGNAAESFNIQLEILLKNIFLGSFTVIPPEVKSGDLPGVAIKLIYSPALEKAMDDARDWNLFVDNMVEMFKYGYGIKTRRTSDFNMINVKGEIIPYVHENIAEIVQLLSQSVLAGVLSQETAIERNPFTRNGEYQKVIKEKHQEEQYEKPYPPGMNKNNVAKEAVTQNIN